MTAPLSTGLFADLRDGRCAVRAHARAAGSSTCSATPAPSRSTRRPAAPPRSVAVDVAAKAHARARKNFAASGFDPEKPEHVVGDAFKVMAKLEERGRRFDMVVIDPPAFASAAARGGKAWSAIRDYAELVAACVRSLEPGGLLVAASSTHKIGAADFELALAEGALAADTELQVIERRGLPADFPTVPGFPEGNYLKFVVAVRR